jgi:hypothetical protein
MKTINKSLNLFFLAFILLSFSMAAQNKDRWQNVKDQYGKASARYIASEVLQAKIIDGDVQEFTNTPLNANVLISTKNNIYNHIFILLTQNGTVPSIKDYKISYIKVYSGSDEIYFEDNLYINDNYIVLNGDLSSTKNLLNTIFNKPGKTKGLVFYVAMDSQKTAKFVLEFATIPY